MKIALAQLNSIVGDIDYNSNLIFEAAKKSSREGARILVTPELSLTGYPPEDLLLRKSFIEKVNQSVKELALKLKNFSGLTVLIGYPKLNDMGLQNCIGVFKEGKEVLWYAKQKLPNNEVFDECRYFIPGNKSCVFQLDHFKVGLILCEDAWYSEPSKMAVEAGANIIIVLNASPFHIDKHNLRIDVIKKRAKECKIPFIYLNSVGGQDELVFDGGSFILNGDGNRIFSMPQFIEILDFFILDTREVTSVAPSSEILLNHEEQIYKALVLGTKDYFKKNGFSKAIIGLSGGIDSALVSKIAADALGEQNVRAVMMPSVFTSEMSLIDAKKLAHNLNIQYDEISIKEIYTAYENSLNSEFKNHPVDTTEENIQARIRGTILMGLSNKFGYIVLTTGNKSELAVGYCTLYGDMAGGFAVIKDLSKSLVYRLCHYININKEIIPHRIISRPPSAELREGQLDQDSLPSYSDLDKIIEYYVEDNMSADEIVNLGLSRDDVNQVLSLIKINEYKRKQSPPGVRLTKRAFGRDWRYPISNKFKG